MAIGPIMTSMMSFSFLLLPASSSGASFFAWQRRARNEWLVIHRKGPWEGYRRQAKRRLARCLLPAFLCAHIERDVWVRGSPTTIRPQTNDFRLKTCRVPKWHAFSTDSFISVPVSKLFCLSINIPIQSNHCEGNSKLHLITIYCGWQNSQMIFRVLSLF